MNKISESIIEIRESDELLKKFYPLFNLEYTPAPIVLHIDSYGGAVYQCFGLLSIMKSKGTPVDTIVTGCAMSCGFLIAIHGNHRKVHENATLMYHQVSSGVRGTAKEIEEEVIEIKRLPEKIEDMTKKYTKINSKQLEKIYKKKTDWYLDAKDAVKWGCADEIV
jgi:ATP-dependent Clp protease protease subunit